MKKITLFSRSVRFFLLLCVVLGSAPYYGFGETSSAQLEKLRHKLSQLQLQYTDKHPDVKKLKRQIDALEKKIVAEEPSQPEPLDPLSENKSVQQDGKKPPVTRNNINRKTQKKPLPATKTEINNQDDDGSWEGEPERWHSTVLGLTLLLHVEYPSDAYPPMLAPKSS